MPLYWNFLVSSNHEFQESWTCLLLSQPKYDASLLWTPTTVGLYYWNGKFHMRIKTIYSPTACFLHWHEFNILLPAINVNWILQKNYPWKWSYSNFIHFFRNLLNICLSVQWMDYLPIAPPQNNNALFSWTNKSLLFKIHLNLSLPLPTNPQLLQNKFCPVPNSVGGAELKTVSQPRNYFRRGIE